MFFLSSSFSSYFYFVAFDSFFFFRFLRLQTTVKSASCAISCVCVCVGNVTTNEYQKNNETTFVRYIHKAHRTGLCWSLAVATDVSYYWMNTRRKKNLNTKFHCSNKKRNSQVAQTQYTYKHSPNTHKYQTHRWKERMVHT